MRTGFGVGRLPVCRTPSISQPLSPLSPLSPVGNIRTFVPSSTNVIARFSSSVLPAGAARVLGALRGERGGRY